ncbi:MAG: hypothetical protein HYZ75_09100 [Elusimicrobia bacterium]|nr:hypothetical protein [Elusimicrobiota bacterium]
MAAFDFLGLKKGLSNEEPPASRPEPKVSTHTDVWKKLVAADVLLALACAGILGWRVVSHLTADPVIPPPTRHEAKKPPPKAAEPAKPEPSKEEPKPEPAKAAPKTSEAALPRDNARSAEVKKPEAAVPLGRPSVLAAPPPQRTAAPKLSGATKASEAKRQTRPVPFTHAFPAAKEVYLIGPFLVRSGGRKMMFKDSKGVWATTVYLNIGQTYKYRFEVVEEKGKHLSASQTVEVLPGD